MNLLLLLLAMISALTGVGGSVRAQETAAAAAAVASIEQASRPAARTVAARREPRLPQLVAVARPTLAASFALAPQAAFFASRRRE
jgi:hypothetical protein